MKNNKRTLLLAGCAVAVMGMLLALQPPDWLEALNLRIFDALARSAAPASASGEVVMVEIDEASLAAHGRWPWPRDVLADLVSSIQSAGASVIALDIVFPETDGAEAPSPGKWAILHGQFGENATNDRMLARVLRQSKVVIGHFGNFGTGSGSANCRLHPVAVSESRMAGASPATFFAPSSVLCSVPEVADAAVTSGFLNVSPDADGILRRVPLLMRFEGAYYPSLPLAAVMAHRSISDLSLESSLGSGTQLRVGEAALPLGASATLTLRYQGGAGSIQRVSAQQVMSGNAEDLQGKLVIVGGAAAGLKDTVATPWSHLFPGLEVHATAMENLLTGSALREGVLGGLGEPVLALFGGFAVTGLFLFARRLMMVAAGALCVALAMWLGAVALVAGWRILLSPGPGILTMASGLMLLLAISLALERKENAAVERRLDSARELMVGMLAHLTQIRDEETGSHLLRMQRYSRVLLSALADSPAFREHYKLGDIELISLLVPIHDIGKAGVPERILRKPGKLTAEEYEQVKLHVEYGREVLKRARSFATVVDEPLVQMAHDIISYHHERWDGKGYPHGVEGAGIPFVGRVVALVDVYDALVSKRVYKQAMSHQEAREVIRAGRGTQFDPQVVDAFFRAEREFERIDKESRDIPETRAWHQVSGA